MDEQKEPSINVMPTLVYQSIRNGAMLEVLLIAVSELLAKERGISKEEMLTKIHDSVKKISKETTEHLSQ